MTLNYYSKEQKLKDTCKYLFWRLSHGEKSAQLCAYVRFNEIRCIKTKF